MTPNIPDKNIQQIKKIYPFSYLTHKELITLTRHAKAVSYAKDEVIIEANTSEQNNNLFLLLNGKISVTREQKLIGHIVAPAYFGERAVFFDQPRKATIVASNEVQCILIPNKDILYFLKVNLSFGYAFAELLRYKQKIFNNHGKFINLLLMKKNKGVFKLEDIIAAYKKIFPILHVGSQGPEIDFNALSYVLSHLPNNITAQQRLVLTESLPSNYPSIKNEKHNFIEFAQGKIFAILRDDTTDYIDILTKYCVYFIETRKIYERMLPYPDIAILLVQEYHGKINKTDHNRLLKKLPFSKQEKSHLARIFTKNYLRQLYEIFLQNGSIKISVLTADVRYSKTPGELWVEQITSLFNTYFEKDILNQDIDIHIISSNTHSVTNCLSSWVHQNGLSQVKTEQFEKLSDVNDRLYAGIRNLLRKNPSLITEKNFNDQQHGIYHPMQHCFTGINVSVIDVDKLTASIDSHLTIKKHEKKRLIFNIDHTYGKQAEHIIANMVLLFNKKIKSISVFSKAGAMLGCRGDILIPDYFIIQENDSSLLIENNDFSQTDLRSTGYSGAIYLGPLLTVLGTLIQSHEMLMFYLNFWHIIGIEMEGGYFMQAINRAKVCGLLDQNLSLRFAYYISDLPLHAEENLTAKLSAEEGIPAVYAITRAVLNKIL